VLENLVLGIGYVGLELGLGEGLGVNESLIANCRYGIRGDQKPVAGNGYELTTNVVHSFHNHQISVLKHSNFNLPVKTRTRVTV